MLVLSRRTGEQIVAPQCGLTVTVLEITGNRVRLGISAPPGLAVHRTEVWQRTAASDSCKLGETLMSTRILIADQDEFLLASCREALGRHGATVDTATTGLGCLEKLRESLPDVLVLEPELLWGGGEGVLALIHEQPELRPLFVILLTRGQNRSLLYRLSPFRVDDYQVKPLTAKRLTERICKLLMSAKSDGTSGLGGGRGMPRAVTPTR
jgi:carbon storage regulator CsrA